ncbi:hypothetical protein BGZ80_011727 [Entomortierella chlamydospora]|uniref:Mitochondrial resolvase Ydc2 catalytic domain-containing protein n=1 Tax=Entomortierella chlamydospora TaxID=101097 RepID=A0A9P6T3T6_9FUNG|nr:hypothetical protein BGZ80_011727 [Entomortierella chlamydospora]
MATGQPLSGKKIELADRLATYLNTIANRIDNLQLAKKKGSTKISSDSLQKKGRAKERTLDQIKGQVLPQSIISIDIGIRNFAWVELSRDGEILRWSIEDLLSTSGSKDNNSTELSTTLPDGNDQTDETTDLGKPKTQQVGSRTRDAAVAAAAIKKTKKKSNPGLPFDLWSVALRVDEIMRRVVTSDSIGAVVVERQRFRTGGMSSILDTVFRCGVIEGMVHSWLAAWKNNRKQRNVNGDGDTDGIRVEENTLVESICPRAVALQWGIGAASRRNSSLKSKDEGQECQAKGEQKTLRKTVTYREKKSQSKAIVENWIYNNDITSKTDNERRNQLLKSKLSQSFFKHSSKLHVRCNPEIKDWYSNQKKRDDLCDSVLQAVSWYEWKQRAIQEAVERAGINQVTFESRGHDRGTDLTTPSNIVGQTSESDNIEKKQKRRVHDVK